VGLQWEVVTGLPASKLVGHHQRLGDLLDRVVAETVAGVTGVKQLMGMGDGSSGHVPRLLLFALSSLLCVPRPV